MLTADFLEGVSDAHPLELLRSAYASVEARSLINRMLALDWRFTLADNDLPKVTRTCELAGVDVVFPLLADELVEFSAALPPRFKLRGTTLRYFFKEALRGFLPDEIIRKRKHGFGLPFGTWIQQEGRLRSYVFDQLGDLRSRGIVRPEFLDELMDSRLRDHGPYFGSLAWVLMMLELWFKEAKALSSSVGRAS
jgi:asparagine synthase (glutamine-hydrolysing)